MLFPILSYSTAAGTSGLLSSATVAQPLAGYNYTYTPNYDGDVRSAGFTWTQAGSGATLFTSARTYDNTGTVSSVSTTLPAGTDNQAFCYDEQDRITWASSASATPPCGGSLTSGSLTSAGYGPVSYGYDTLDRMTSSPSGANVYGDSAHLHAETSIGTAYSARYDAAGNMTCRAPTSSTPCSGGANGELLTYDTEGRLTTWQNAPSNPTATEAMAYDGEGNRVALQVNGGTPTYYLGSLQELSGSTLTMYITGSSAGADLPVVEAVGSRGTLSRVAGDMADAGARVRVRVVRLVNPELLVPLMGDVSRESSVPWLYPSRAGVI
ncbi:MAG TPA: hypothetical protein VF120_13535 [Ktedonobacterales bacterium]